jgi:threonine aldolase
MRFFSDNAAACCPEVLAALGAANRLDTAYDGDALSKRLDGAFSDLFGTEVRALWVATGTAANSLALAALCPPHGSIVCHRDAHIQNDECGAPEFYTHGAKLLLAEGEGAKLTPDTVQALLATVRNDVHQVQPARCRSPTRPNMAWSTRRTKSRRWANWPGRAGSASTWTARASPMPWRGSAAIRPT